MLSVRFFSVRFVRISNLNMKVRCGVLFLNVIRSILLLALPDFVKGLSLCGRPDGVVLSDKRI